MDVIFHALSLQRRSIFTAEMILTAFLHQGSFYLGFLWLLLALTFNWVHMAETKYICLTRTQYSETNANKEIKIPLTYKRAKEGSAYNFKIYLRTLSRIRLSKITLDLDNSSIPSVSSAIPNASCVPNRTSHNKNTGYSISSSNHTYGKNSI